MSRFLTPVVLAALTLGLTACGGERKTEAEPAATPAAAPAETAPAPAAAPAAAADPALQPTALAGDPARGQRLFGQCRSCHVLEPGVNRVGPSLHGIVGRTAGQVPGFKYSDANAGSQVVWTEENLSAFLEAPRKFMPGTKMSYAGMRDPQQRADLIAYLKTQG